VAAAEAAVWATVVESDGPGDGGGGAGTVERHP
jgi:hypothetical protein